MRKDYRRQARGKKWVLVILAVIALALSVNTQAKKIYKWVDEQGNTHYGDAVPSSVGSAQEIIVPATPEVDPSVNTRKQRTERLLESFQQERAEKRETQQAAAKELRKRRDNCERAKKSQYKYEHAAFLYSTDEDGNRVILGDEEYAIAMAKAQANVEQWCG